MAFLSSTPAPRPPGADLAVDDGVGKGVDQESHLVLWPKEKHKKKEHKRKKKKIKKKKIGKGEENTPFTSKNKTLR